MMPGQAESAVPTEVAGCAAQVASLPAKVKARAEQPIELCFHCHKCTAGCPVAHEMRYGPDRVLQMVQLGQEHRLLTSGDIWLCAGCELCAARCPNEIDMARVMDALRQLALAQGVRPADPSSVKFHRLFLFLIERLGRMNEAGLLGAHKLWTGNLFADLGSGAVMILKGKIPLVPHVNRDRAQLRRLFARSSRPGRPGSGAGEPGT
jgi:heterodisulfide reductase subunit C